VARTTLLRREDATHVVHLRNVQEERNKVEELRVVGIVEPRVDGHRILWVEEVGRGGVVNDDDVLQRSAQLAQILDVVAAVADTRLTKEAVVAYLVNVQQVHDGIRVLGEGRGKDNNLKLGAHLFHKLVDTGALQHVHLMYRILNFDRNNEISIGHRFEGGVNQCLV